MIISSHCSGRNSTKVTYLLLTILLSSYTVSAQTPPNNAPLFPDYRDIISLRKTHEYGSFDPDQYDPDLDTDSWIRIVHLAPGPRDGILITDEGLQRVDLVVPNEGIVVSFGLGKGAGPGEFRGVRYASWNGANRILVSDFTNIRVSVFTADGEYLKELHPNIVPAILTCPTEETVWIHPGLNRETDLFLSFNIESGEQIERYTGYFQDEKWYGKLTADPHITSTAIGVLLSVPYPYRVLEISPQGEVLRTIGREIDWLSEPYNESWRQNRQVLYPHDGYVVSPMRTANGYTVVQVCKRERTDRLYNGIPLRESIHYLDFFNGTGRWLCTLPVADFCSENALHFTIATDSALWITTSGDFHRVERYKIEWLEDIKP